MKHDLPTPTIRRYDTLPLGLPDRAIVFTNSDRATSACARRWWFSEVEGLRTRSAARPLQYGAAWALMLEDVHRWWMEHDSAYPVGGEDRCVWCGGVGCEECYHGTTSGFGPLARTLQDWQRAQRHGLNEGSDPDRDAEALRRALAGWFRDLGTRAPSDEYRVVGVEVAFAAPVRGPTGALFTPETVLYREGPHGMRLARTGEGRSPAALTVRWPWYQIGKLDALYQHRVTGDLLVWEGKTSGDPKGYLQGLSVDPQVPGYIWLLGHHLPTYGAKRVAGFLYDVSSSAFQADPPLLKPEPVRVLGEDGQPLKQKGRNVYQLGPDGEPVLRSPGLSRATSAGTVPSWRFQEAIARHGFDPDHYREHVSKLQVETDPKLYLREFGTVGPEAVARYSRELYGVARRFSQQRRDAAMGSVDDLDAAFPRTAVCRLGGRCAYRGPCLQDGPNARADFDVDSAMTWTESNDNNEPVRVTEQELGW